MPLRTEIVPSFGMRAVGGFGVRGHRAHCDCGYLSRVASYRMATEYAYKHRREHKGGDVSGTGDQWSANEDSRDFEGWGPQIEKLNRSLPTWPFDSAVELAPVETEDGIVSLAAIGFCSEGCGRVIIDATRERFVVDHPILGPCPEQRTLIDTEAPDELPACPWCANLCSPESTHCPDCHVRLTGWLEDGGRRRPFRRAGAEPFA